MAIQSLTSIETEHTRFLYQSAYTPLSQQPYLLSTPFIEADTFPLGSVFFLVFDSPSADVQAEFATGVRRTLTFRMADGDAVTAPVSCVSFLSGQTLYVAFTLLATIFLLPTPHLQGASSMVFLPRDGSDAPVESVYANNGVGQVPLAGGTPITTSDNKVTAPAMVQVTNFPTNGSAISSADGALASVGNTADTAYTSGAGTMIAILKGIFAKVAGTLTTSVSNWPSSQAVTGSVSVSNLPTTQAVTGTDGSQATIGTTTDTTSATTLVGLLKSIKSALLGTLAASVSGSVAVTNFPATQAESIVDGSDVTQGAKADSAATDSTSSWSIVALLKGVYAKLASSLSFIQPDVTTTGTITAAQPTAGTPVTGGSVTIAVGNGQSSWKAQLTGLTTTDVIVVDHSSDGGTTWNSSNFTVAGATVNTPVSSITAITGSLEIAGNDSAISHLKIRCSTYNSGDTISVLIRSGFGIGRVGIMSSLPAGTNNIGLVSNDATFAKETGGNLASVVSLLTNPANPSYEYNAGGPGGGTIDRVRNVQGKGVQSWTIASGGAATGQNVVTLTSTPLGTLVAGAQIQLLGGTQENAYVASLSGNTVTLTQPIANANHTTIQWDTYAQNGPLGSLMTAIGMGIRGLALYKSSASATTPYVQAQADANNNLLVGSADGAMVTQGILGDSPATSGTGGSWSLAALLRGILNGILATQKVKGDYTVVTGLSVNAAGADLVPATDISAYKWWSLQLAGTWTGTLTFAGSNDGTNFTNVDVMKFSSPSFLATSVTSAGSFGDIIAGVAGYTYLRVRANTGWTSGPATGVLALFTSAPPPHVVGTIASQNGTWVVQPGNTANTTPWLVNTADGGEVTIGAKADATTNDTTSAWSVVSLLKGIYAKIAGTIAVSGTFWQATQPISTADGSNLTQGAKADSAATDSTSSWSMVALLKGMVAQLLKMSFDGSGNLKVTGGVGGGGGAVTAVSGGFVDGAIVTMGTESDGAATSGTGGTWTLAALLRGILNGIQATLKVKGDFVEQTGLSATTSASAGGTSGSSTADLVQSIDVSAYKWWSLHVLTMATGGTLTFQASNDNSTWQSIEAYITSSTAAFATSTTTTGIYYGACNFRYLRVRQTAFTSGSTTGILELYTAAGAFTSSPVLASGSSTIGGVFIKSGASNAAVGIGASSNTVIKASAGSIGRVLVTGIASGATGNNTGTTDIKIYDNASTNSGTVIGFIPLTAIMGQVFEFSLPASLGITVGGNAGNAGFTISYS